MFAYPNRKIDADAYNAAVLKTDPLRQFSMLRRYCEATNYMVCAKVDNHIAGVAIWTPPKDKQRIVPLHIRILKVVLSIYDKIVGYTYPDWLWRRLSPSTHAARSAEALRRQEIMKLDNEIREKSLPAEMKEGTYWTLSVLGVSEEYGRRGIGTKLLQWGFERADEDDRPIFVSASQEGAALYRKNGFEVLYHASQVFRDPIKGWIDQTYLIRWNKTQRVKP